MNARQWLLSASRAWDRLRPPPAGVTILIYHRVGGGTDSLVDLPAELFTAQMQLVADSRPVLALDDAVRRLRAGEAVDGVVLTFDDGTADFADVAVPIMARHGLPSTLYAATGFIDRCEPMPWGAPSATWDQLRSTVATGLVTIESHTHDHPLFHRLDAAAAAEQLDASVASIVAEIGAAPRHFAYPKAVTPSPQAELAVRSRFTSAALAGSRVNQPGCDLLRLGRTPVQRRDDPETFAAKLRGGLRLEGIVRDRVTARRAERAE